MSIADKLREIADAIEEADAEGSEFETALVEIADNLRVEGLVPADRGTLVLADVVDGVDTAIAAYRLLAQLNDAGLLERTYRIPGQPYLNIGEAVDRALSGAL
jgi:hypothetical protein